MSSQPKDYDITYKVLLIGESAVGKTSLIRCYSKPDQSFTSTLMPTYGEYVFVYYKYLVLLDFQSTFLSRLIMTVFVCHLKQLFISTKIFLCWTSYNFMLTCNMHHRVNWKITEDLAHFIRDFFFLMSGIDFVNVINIVDGIRVRLQIWFVKLACHLNLW